VACGKGKDVALADGAAEAYLLALITMFLFPFYENTPGNVPS